MSLRGEKVRRPYERHRESHSALGRQRLTEVVREMPEGQTFDRAFRDQFDYCCDKLYFRRTASWLHSPEAAIEGMTGRGG